MEVVPVLDNPITNTFGFAAAPFARAGGNMINDPDACYMY